MDVTRRASSSSRSRTLSQGLSDCSGCISKVGNMSQRRNEEAEDVGRTTGCAGWDQRMDNKTK